VSNKILTKQLHVRLTEEEVKAKGEELARTVAEKSKLDHEKKKIVGDYNGQIKTLENKIFTLATVVETGKELRDVPVKKELDAKRNICRIIRTDTFELVETRPMTPEERQTELWEEEDEILG
jgi:hypothetical protein